MNKKVFLGYEKWEKSKNFIFLKDIEKTGNCHIIGQTGFGKSHLMRNMAMQDIKDGEWICVIDPFGNLAQDIFENIPENRKKDIIFLNFEKNDFWINIFNFVSDDTEEERQILISELMQIFSDFDELEKYGESLQKEIQEIFPEIFPEIFENAMLTLFENKNNNFLDLPKLFSDEIFLQKQIKNIKNPLLKDFWKDFFSHKNEYPEFVRSAISYFLDEKFKQISIEKISKFLNNSHDLDFLEIITERKILICSLNMGLLGKIGSDLIGRIILHKINIASNLLEKEEENGIFCVYIDEFQRFYNSKNIEILLKNSHDGRISLTFAHQFLLQISQKEDILQDDFARTVFENAKTKIIFKLWLSDAKFISKIFPNISSKEIQKLPPFEAFVKSS